MSRSLLLMLTLSACRPAAREETKTSIDHLAHATKGVHCTRCHVGIQESAEASTTHLPSEQICIDCHEKAHEPTGCLSCHVDDDTYSSLERRGEALVFSHAGHEEAAKGSCLKCHGPGLTPTMDDCRPCHDDWLDGLACDKCHLSLAAYPLVPVTHQAHQGDFLRRHAAEARVGIERCTTCHAQSFCAECHDRRAPFTAALAWADRPDRDFIHRPNYEARHAAEARLEPQLCLGCHAEPDCATCHTAIGRGPGGHSPHPTGWASPGPGPNRHGPAARRDLLGCASCHSGAGADLCVDCHAVGRPGGTPHQSRPRGDTDRQPCVRCHRGRP